MSEPAVQKKMTYQEYLALQDEPGRKDTWHRGEIFAMSGASLDHNRIAMRLTGAILSRLKAGCEAVGSDQRVRIDAADVSCYPDLSVVCGDWQTPEDDALSIVNPRVIFEVLSPSTEAYDRGSKFQSLQKLDSLRHYVLLSQEERRIELFTRNDDGTWTFTTWLEGDVPLEAIDLRLPVQACYDGVI